MVGIRSLSSCFRPNRGSQSSVPVPERPDSRSRPAQAPSGTAPSKGGLPPLGPGLQRVDSNPARLPSNVPERTQVDPARSPITRATPDAKPPKDFGRLFGMRLPFRTNAGGNQKSLALGRDAITIEDLEPELRRNPELMDIIKERHPNFDAYGTNAKASTLKLLGNHPGYAVALTKMQNERLRMPTGPTATRKMKPGEQKFLTNAFRKLNEDIREHPFHMHGETAITGTKDGRITQFNHSPGGTSHASPAKGDKYHLHTHPPFMEPFTSSASAEDHILAARFYSRDNNKTGTYVTNGKDVLHIQPDSTELVKLIPDPKQEKKLGKFPVAFSIPDPERPPNPFSNHEAPAAYESWDPPARQATRRSNRPPIGPSI